MMSSYNKTIWKDSPETMINSERLNKMEEGIQNAHDGENIPDFVSFDAEDECEAVFEVPSIERGDKLKDILTKITKFCNNIRYLFNFVKVEDIHNAGYASVADALKTIGKDYIIEQGTSGIWHYTKWASGEVELWARSSVTCVVSTLSGGNVYRSEIQSIELPFTVYNITYQITCTDHNSWASASYVEGDATNIGIVIWRANSFTSYAWGFNALVKGRWKK